MRSLKDALDLYRTLLAEGLSEFSNSERGEAAGRRLDDLAWRLSRKVALPSKPIDMSEAWQQVHGIDFAKLIEEVEAPTRAQAERLSEVYRPAFEQVAETLRHLEGVEWKTPTIPSAEERAKAFREYAWPKFDVPKFVEFEVEPWQVAMQDSVNAMLRRQADIRRQHEAAFLPEVDDVAGFHLPLSDPTDSVDDTTP